MYTSPTPNRSEEHTSELQSQFHLVCRLLLEKKKCRQCLMCLSPRPLMSRKVGAREGPQTAIVHIPALMTKGPRIRYPFKTLGCRRRGGGARAFDSSVPAR